MMKQPQRPSINPNSNLNLYKSDSNIKKFLPHLQSINTPVKIPTTFLTSASSSKNKYTTIIQQYTHSLSIIDKIADSPVKESRISHGEFNEEDIVEVPMLVSLNPRTKQRVVNINNFFHSTFKDNREIQYQEVEGGLNGYIQSIINIDTHNTIQRSQQSEHRRSNSRSKSKQSTPIKLTQRKITPPVQKPQPIVKIQQAEVNTEPIVPTERIQNNRLKKIDLLLVEVIREKKRKGFMPDYYRAIEMKLVQLLEYILQDQPEYYGLSLVDKMKEVLKNLQSFKGKTIEGESKVNMLRIFFLQFRNLKKQREQQSENRSKSQSRKSASKAQSKKSGHNQTTSPLLARNKKNFDTFSVGGNRNNNKTDQKRMQTAKSVKEQDQWIGSLQH